MTNLELAVEVELITHVITTSAIGPTIVFVLGIGCIPSQQQGSMFSSQFSLFMIFSTYLFWQVNNITGNIYDGDIVRTRSLYNAIDAVILNFMPSIAP